MVRPWPVDFLNNAVITINNYMSPWTGMGLGFLLSSAVVINLVKTPCSPPDTIYFYIFSLSCLVFLVGEILSSSDLIVFVSVWLPLNRGVCSCMI